MILSSPSRLNGSLESHSIILYLQWTINGLFSTHQYLEVKNPLMVYSLRREENFNDDGLKCCVCYGEYQLEMRSILSVSLAVCKYCGFTIPWMTF